MTKVAWRKTFLGNGHNTDSNVYLLPPNISALHSFLHLRTPSFFKRWTFVLQRAVAGSAAQRQGCKYMNYL